MKHEVWDYDRDEIYGGLVYCNECGISVDPYEDWYTEDWTEDGDGAGVCGDCAVELGIVKGESNGDQ